MSGSISTTGGHKLWRLLRLAATPGPCYVLSSRILRSYVLVCVLWIMHCIEIIYPEVTCFGIMHSGIAYHTEVTHPEVTSSDITS